VASNHDDSVLARNRGGRLDVGVPRSLFQVRVTMGLGSDRSGFDVTSDGRFLVPTLVQERRADDARRQLADADSKVDKQWFDTLP